MALYTRLKRQFLSRVILARVAIVLGAFIILGLTWVFVVRPVGKQAQHIVSSYTAQLPQVNGRTNFLLLGVGGANHDGPDLTDTMILFSVTSSGSATLISVPRDIWVPSLKAKINTAYHYGEDKQPNGGGFVLARAAVEEVTNQPVQYAAMINFANFEKFIDSLGGVDINVDQAFDDYQYPIDGKENDLCDGDPTYACRYEHLHFDAGLQHMDGARALKYVRSRHADGEEGTDFARSKRQEKLLVAIKTKLLSTDILTHPDKIKALYDSLSQSITTDFDPNLYPALVRLAITVAQANSIHTVAITAPDQLYNPPVSPDQYDGQWVLLPKDGNWQTVFDFVANSLNK